MATRGGRFGRKPTYSSGNHYCALIVKIIGNVFRIFEDHVELIIRGRAGVPFELGHKIFLSQSRSKFILDYSVCERNKPDTALLEQMVTRHEEQFGKGSLKKVHGDKGCRAKESEMKKIQERVENVCVPSRLKDLHEPDLVESQKFRAGIEGSISCLKRIFHLARTNLCFVSCGDSL